MIKYKILQIYKCLYTGFCESKNHYETEVLFKLIYLTKVKNKYN